MKSPKAVEVILAKHGARIAEVVTKYITGFEGESDPAALARRVLDALIAADPSPNSIYVDRMILWMQRGAWVYADDLEHALCVLEIYTRLKPSLPQAQRDVGRFDYWWQFEDFVGSLPGVDIMAYIRSKDIAAYEQSLFDAGEASLFLDTDAMRIVIPHTLATSIYFGKGAKWCTAMEGSRHFEVYNRSGYLYIVTFKDTGARWQLHLETNSYCDERDRPVFNYHEVLALIEARRQTWVRLARKQLTSSY
ncbi:hypothetical protein HOU02_gp215 [Caulobacter phage CcrBL9]|uniref:Uncharacterized protein n=1 Tax=Caulobacter phage CcrBL9 TaxID=2283270 RepID=A0A385ECX8_9CAUD|nr:hypothetical protein HOU02_gp215 [Caulobacter phage CcrBL9]AXQ69510.1 hypothetical protein CcrBL9_gp486 [Caulobacter phage CcrBL9]